jgi:two-component system, cell cycle response regulator
VGHGTGLESLRGDAMPSVLVVDDTPSIRALVAALMRRLGIEIAEARDGLEGLSTLADCRFDVILLDIMMPNMDGPTMLARMREGGDTTPVILLTAESDRPRIASAMKAGIADYVIKPFEPAELSRKVVSVIERTAPGYVVPISMPGGADAAGLRSGPARSPRKQFVDLMVVDDMENVCKRLRSMLPKHVTVNGFTCAQSALASAGEKSYRVVLVDTDIPAVDSIVLAQQLRQLQSGAVFGALAMRTSAVSEQKALGRLGFEVLLLKPFTQEEVDEVLVPRLEKTEVLTREENLLKLGPFAGEVDACERYFGKLFRLFPGALKEVAGASYGEVIVDLGSVPIHADLLPRLLAWTAQQARDLGLDILAVCPAKVSKALGSFEETKAIRCFSDLKEARAAGPASPPT